jgi:hypothetical protein
LVAFQGKARQTRKGIQVTTATTTTWEGRIDGQYNYGACGMVPLIRIDRRKPKLRNNGYNCFCGHPLVHVPGLAAAIPAEDDRPIRQGHVMVIYSDGSRFGTYASTGRGGDVYDFS